MKITEVPRHGEWYRTGRIPVGVRCESDVAPATVSKGTCVRCSCWFRVRPVAIHADVVAARTVHCVGRESGRVGVTRRVVSEVGSFTDKSCCCTGESGRCTGKPGRCTSKLGCCASKPGRCANKPGRCANKPGRCAGKPGRCAGKPGRRTGKPGSFAGKAWCFVGSEEFVTGAWQGTGVGSKPLISHMYSFAADDCAAVGGDVRGGHIPVEIGVAPDGRSLAVRRHWIRIGRPGPENLSRIALEDVHGQAT